VPVLAFDGSATYHHDVFHGCSMSAFRRKCTHAIAFAMICLGGQAAHAQVAPVQYWIPSGLFGFGGSWTDGNSASIYRNFPGFDAGNVRDGDWRDNFRTGMFVSGQSGSVGLNGFGQLGAVSDFGGLSYQGALANYNFKGAGNLPVTVYAGFDALNYRPGLGSPLAPFNSDATIKAGYTARAGIAFQPNANVILSLEAGFTQRQLGGDGNINSPLLPGDSPFVGGRR
jgi:hypothetical protein